MIQLPETQKDTFDSSDWFKKLSITVPAHQFTDHAGPRNPRLFRAAKALRRNTEAHSFDFQWTPDALAHAELANARMILQACGFASLESFYEGVRKEILQTHEADDT